MGAGSSRAAAGPAPVFVLRNPAASSLDITVQFSPNLLRRLQGVDDRGLHSSAEPGYSPQDLDRIVQDRVARELAGHQQRRFFNEQRSADQVRREAEDLMRRQKSIPKPEPKSEYVQAQQAVLECYKNHPSRPLDCWREVQAFKDIEKASLKEFVATAAATI